MGFHVSEISKDGLDVVEVKNLSNEEYFNIVPRYGGAINEIVLSKNRRLYPIHKSAKSLVEFQ